MTENPTETERNEIISSFFCVLVFPTLISLKTKRYFTFLSIKFSSVRSVRRKKVTKFMASDGILFRRIFLPKKFSTDEFSKICDFLFLFCNLLPNSTNTYVIRRHLLILIKCFTFLIGQTVAKKLLHCI